MPRTLSDLIDGNAPVRAGEADYETLFKDLQCNILTPHLRRRAYYWLVQFGDSNATDAAIIAKYLLGQLARSHFGRVAVRTLLDNRATRSAMSEDLQRIAKTLGADSDADANLEMLNGIRDVTILSEYENYWKRQNAPAAPAPAAQADQERTAPHPIHVNVLLSSSAYTKLGFPRPLSSEAFQQGMAARGRRTELRDPTPDQWDEEYREGVGAKQFDALLIVGCDPKSPTGAGRSLADHRQEVLSRFSRGGWRHHSRQTDRRPAVHGRAVRLSRRHESAGLLRGRARAGRPE